MIKKVIGCSLVTACVLMAAVSVTNFNNADAYHLDGHQKKVVKTALKVAKQKKASPKEVKAMIATGIVESNLRNLSYGDRDSLGVFQQRPSMGWGSAKQVRNVRHATKRFLAAAKKKNRPHMKAGTLAQAVQASAFPGRYHAVSGTAAKIIKKFNRIERRKAKRAQKRKKARQAMHKKLKIQKMLEMQKQQNINMMPTLR